MKLYEKFLEEFNNVNDEMLQFLQERLTIEEYLNFVGVDSQAAKEIAEIEEDIKEYYGEDDI